MTAREGAKSAGLPLGCKNNTGGAKGPVEEEEASARTVRHGPAEERSESGPGQEGAPGEPAGRGGAR